MPVETIGSPLPEADQLRAEIEQQLAIIFGSFSQVSQDRLGFADLRVGGFTLVPAGATADSVSCAEESCPIS